MKEKLIHTDLLSKYDHSSAVGFATASHFESAEDVLERVKAENE